MPEMTYPKMRQSVHSKKEWQPIYFLYGAEDLFIDDIASYVESNVLQEGEESFNKTVLYGKDTNARQVIDCVVRAPMMAEKQLVVLREAQMMSDFDKLLDLVERPVPSTVLLITYHKEKVDGRSSIFKKLKKEAQVLKATKLYENQVPDWIKTHLSEKKIDMSPRSIQLLVEYLGNDLKKIKNAIDQLSINAEAGSSITDDQVEKNIGVSRDYNVFELQEALGQKNLKKALRITEWMAVQSNQSPIHLIIPSLFNYYSKLYALTSIPKGNMDVAKKTVGIFNDYVVRRYLSAASNFNQHTLEDILNILGVYDLRSKGVDHATIPLSELMREMMYKILSVR